MLKSDLMTDGKLDAPLYIGSFLLGLSLSGDLSGDGTGLAALSGGTGGYMTGDADIGYTPVIPLPASGVLYLAGFSLLTLFRSTHS